MQTGRILVTGGAGLIGRHVTARLVGAAEELLVYDLLVHGQRPPDRVRFEHFDLRDPNVVGSIRSYAPDLVIHLAGLAEISRCQSHPLEAIEHNVTTTANVVTALEQRPAALILASSAAVYARSSDPHAEGEVCVPSNVYGKTKLRCEALAHQHFARTGAPTTVLRLGSVYGPGDMIDRVVPTILKQLRAGSATVHLGNLSARRDFVYAADLAEIMAWLTSNGPDWSVLNVGTGTARTISALVDCFRAATSSSIKVLTSAEPKADETDVIALDVSRLRTLIADPTPTGLEEGIKLLLATGQPVRPQPPDSRSVSG